MDLLNQLDTLLGDFQHLEPRIRTRNYQSDACGERINVRCNYLTFRNGEPTFDEFIGVLDNHIIPFCLPRSEIRHARKLVSEGDHVAASVAMQQLSSKARNLFIKAKLGSHRSGEAGEIALYLLNEWILKAPQIVSKMYLKTNNQMPVHGFDGIHARYDHESKKLYLYWGESKAHENLTSALGSALDSIKEALDKGHLQREIEIISDHADFDQLDKDAVDALLKYFDPYSAESNERIETHSCLLLFTFCPDHAGNSEEREKEFIEEIDVQVTSFISSIQNSIKNKQLTSRCFEFFLFPVPCVQELRDKFQAKIGWPANA